MIRALRPTDVLAYLSFQKLTPDNEALIGADENAARPTLGSFLGGPLPRYRERWVAVERGRIIGLVAAQPRTVADIWDVEQLMAAPDEDTGKVYIHLLDHLCGEAVEEGVQKVFLRLRESSDAVGVARQVGFFRFTTEYVYQRASAAPPPSLPLEALRPRRPIDHQALFQLYSAAVPAFVRQVEALTLQEWRWLDGWRAYPVPWRPRATRRDFVLVADGAALGWLRIDVSGRALGLLVDGREPGLASGLVGFGLAHLGPGGPVTLALRDYQGALGSQLEPRGFELVAKHALLARPLAIRVPEGRLMPIRI